MARTLDQISKQLDSTYAGSRSAYQAKLDALPGEIEAGIAQADAKLGQANDQILAGARRRGLGFSGIPVGEQAEYAATEYAPAIANLKSSGRNTELSILDALSGLDRERLSQAQGIRDSELAREFQERQFKEQQRQFNLQLEESRKQAAAARAAAATAGVGAYLGGGGTKTTAAPRVVQSRPGSFAFYDANNRPITAAQYARQSGTNIGDLLYEMGTAGDRSAQYAYNQLKDRPNDPTMMNILKRQFSHIFGGV